MKRIFFILSFLPLVCHAQNKNDFGIAPVFASEVNGGGYVFGLRLNTSVIDKKVFQPGVGLEVLTTNLKAVACIGLLTGNFRLSQRRTYMYLGLTAGYIIQIPGNTGPLIGAQLGVVAPISKKTCFYGEAGARSFSIKYYRYGEVIKAAGVLVPISAGFRFNF
jgi:hypothetical protein